jgi:hypothetical protein
MALKIGGMAPPVEEMPTEMPVEEMPIEEPMPDMAGGLVSPEAARYFGPESRCAGCIHFMDPGTCEIVAGPIDPQGVCVLFEPDQEMLDEPMLPTDGATEPEIAPETPEDQS